MDTDINICVRCGKMSYEKMTTIPEPFVQAGEKICNDCGNEVWNCIVNLPISDEDESEE